MAYRFIFVIHLILLLGLIIEGVNFGRIRTSGDSVLEGRASHKQSQRISSPPLPIFRKITARRSKPLEDDDADNPDSIAQDLQDISLDTLVPLQNERDLGGFTLVSKPTPRKNSYTIDSNHPLPWKFYTYQRPPSNLYDSVPSVYEAEDAANLPVLPRALSCWGRMKKSIKSGFGFVESLNRRKASKQRRTRRTKKPLVNRYPMYRIPLPPLPRGAESFRTPEVPRFAEAKSPMPDQPEEEISLPPNPEDKPVAPPPLVGPLKTRRNYRRLLPTPTSWEPFGKERVSVIRVES